MKKTVKAFITALALGLVMGLASACGGSGGAADGTGGFSTVEAGVLIMATNAEFPPYEFWEGGKIVGIDAEIAEAIAAKLGLTLRIDDIDFNAILPAVTSGRADMGMAGMTITEERMESVNFSTSYATGIQVIIVADGSPITSADDLFDIGGFTIGVQETTTGDLYTTWDLEDEGLATIQRYRRGADAVQALVTGRVDCVVIDNEPAKAFVAMNPGLHILDTEFAAEDYAIAFAKNNTALRDAVDGALRELIADGTVARIIEKYIKAD
jgi:polar amino acid transport system substrate-binding protein